MNIAIIGTGLSGLATAWFLLNKDSLKPCSVTLFDSLDVGAGTSGMAGGLLHPFVGASAKLNQHGLEGYQSTCRLLDIVSQKIGQSVVTSQGLLRVAITEKQKQEFQLSSEKYSQVTWWAVSETVKKIPGVNHQPGIFIQDSVTVDCQLYLKGLFEACIEKGAGFEKRHIRSIDELQNYDRIVVATGALAKELVPFAPLAITQVKGQILELTWPQNLDPLPFAISSQAYFLMNKDKNSCVIGATYERNFNNLLPDVVFASQDILPKAYALLPAFTQSRILNCKAGVRASTPDHMPIIKQVNEKCWVISGMGSRGLLYHAFYAEKLARLLEG